MQTSNVTPEVLLERARAIAPLLAERVAQTERDRQVSPETITLLRDADLYRVFLPSRFGGFEFAPSVYAAISIELSKGCGASGWVYAVTQLQQFLVSTFPSAAQLEIFGENPQAIIAAAFAPGGTLTSIAGGYVLTGRWSYASGCGLADWFLASVLLPSVDGAPGARAFAALPRADFRIEDTWQAAAMSGTGSNDVIVDSAFVPSHRVNLIDDMSKGSGPGLHLNTNPMYRLPYQSVVTTSVVAPILGMLEGALDAFVATVGVRSTRVSTVGSRAPLADLAFVQSRIGEGYGLLDASKHLVFANLAEMLELAGADRSYAAGLRIKWRRDYALATDLCVRAIDGLFRCLGASALLLDNRIQRAWRDINGASRHAAVNWDTYSVMYGQHVLGQEPKGQF